MDDRMAQELVLRLRRFRSGRSPDLTITRELESLRRRLKRSAGSREGLSRAWLEEAPSPHGARASVVSVSRGRIVLTCADAGARYRLEAWLRTGGLARLREASGVALVSWGWRAR